MNSWSKLIHIKNVDLKFVHQLTSDGDELSTFNGIPDWQFSLEITDDDVLFWWSSNSTYFAYASIHHFSKDTEYQISFYNNFQYPQRNRFPYPKAGSPIPTTSLVVVDTNTLQSVEINPNLDPSWNNEYYLNSAIWRGDVFTPTWKNRYQNESVSENCVKPDFTCSHGYNMTLSISSGWLGNYKISFIFPLENSDEYFTVQSNEGFPHVALYNVVDDSLDFRTSGNFEVTDKNLGYDCIHHYDVTNDWVYFTSTEILNETGEGIPRKRQIWRVKGHGEDRERQCVSCDARFYLPYSCDWVEASFSHNGSYMGIDCLGGAEGVPGSMLFRRGNSSGLYSIYRFKERNDLLGIDIAGYDFRAMEFATLQLPGEEINWPYMLLKPPNFDPTNSYPLLVEVYSGPGFQTVTDKFDITWVDYVASSKNVIVMKFEGRGAGFMGDRARHVVTSKRDRFLLDFVAVQVYKKLGEYEPLDQISAVQHLVDTFPYIDRTRIAIWGKSYGGWIIIRL